MGLIYKVLPATESAEPQVLSPQAAVDTGLKPQSPPPLSFRAPELPGEGANMEVAGS